MLSFQRKKIKGFEGFQFSSITLLFQSLRLVVKMMMAVLFFCLSMKFYKYTYKKQKKVTFFFFLQMIQISTTFHMSNIFVCAFSI